MQTSKNIKNDQSERESAYHLDMIDQNLQKLIDHIEQKKSLRSKVSDSILNLIAGIMFIAGIFLAGFEGNLGGVALCVLAHKIAVK